MTPQVLIVEDEFVQAMALEQLVTSLGYGVLPLASTVKAAMAVLKITTPDAAIVDIQLDGARMPRRSSRSWRNARYRSPLSRARRRRSSGAGRAIW